MFCEKCKVDTGKSIQCPECGDVVVELKKPQKACGVPAILSFFIPGLGSLVNGRVLHGVFFFFATGFGYILILPGFVVHIASIIYAYQGK